MTRPAVFAYSAHAHKAVRLPGYTHSEGPGMMVLAAIAGGGGFVFCALVFGVAVACRRRRKKKVDEEKLQQVMRGGRRQALVLPTGTEDGMGIRPVVQVRVPLPA